MFPVIYAPNETDFTTQGLGVLIDCLTCEVTEERNGIYEATLTYPTTGHHADALVTGGVFKAVAHRGDSGQLFEIYEVSTDYNGDIEVHARHISYRLGYIPCSPFSASNVVEAFTKLPQYMTETAGFTFQTSKTTTASFSFDIPKATRNVLGGEEGSILDVYRGEYEFDNFVVKLHGNRGSDKGVVLRYGKNITDISQEQEISETYTGLYPYYNNEDLYIELPEKVVYCANASNFAYHRVLMLDCTNEFKDEYDDPKVPTEAEMRAFAQTYMTEHDFGIPKVSLSVSFDAESLTNMEYVLLCDTVTVMFPELNVSSKSNVVKTVYDTILAKYKSIEIGSLRSNFASTLNSTVSDKTTEEIANTSTRLERAQQRATETLLGRNGGYKIEVTNADGQIVETLFMDTLDEATATKIWRWNVNGLGFSPNGAQGPYTIAMTKDGEIVADFITTGTLDAAKITVSNLYANSILVTDNENVNQALRRLELSDEGLSSTISNMKIGGRNILRGTGNPTKGSGTWASGTFRNSSSGGTTDVATISDSPIPGITKAFKIVTSGANLEIGMAQDGYSVQGHIGDMMTFSFWAKGPAGGKIRMQPYWSGTSGEAEASAVVITLTQNNVWEKFVFVSKAIEYNHSSLSIGYFYPYSTTGAATFYITGLMLEWGNKATEWTPAPEDTDTAVGNLQSQITQNAENITLKVSSTDYTGAKIASLINQSASTVTISASHIKLEGIVTANNYFKINTNGSMEASGAKISGDVTISSDKYSAAFGTKTVSIPRFPVANLYSESMKGLYSQYQYSDSLISWAADSFKYMRGGNGGTIANNVSHSRIDRAQWPGYTSAVASDTPVTEPAEASTIIFKDTTMYHGCYKDGLYHRYVMKASTHKGAFLQYGFDGSGGYPILAFRGTTGNGVASGSFQQPYLEIRGNISDYTKATGYIGGKQIQVASTSSRRYKHSIRDLSDADLDPHKLYELRARQFVYNAEVPVQYKGMERKTLPGYIAEELEKVYPAAAIYNEDNQIESWDERRIIPGMMELIKEQHERIKKLEEKICTLS